MVWLPFVVGVFSGEHLMQGCLILLQKGVLSSFHKLFVEAWGMVLQ